MSKLATQQWGKSMQAEGTTAQGPGGRAVPAYSRKERGGQSSRNEGPRAVRGTGGHGAQIMWDFQAKGGLWLLL